MPLSVLRCGVSARQTPTSKVHVHDFPRAGHAVGRQSPSEGNSDLEALRSDDGRLCMRHVKTFGCRGTSQHVHNVRHRVPLVDRSLYQRLPCVTHGIPVGIWYTKLYQEPLGAAYQLRTKVHSFYQTQRLVQPCTHDHLVHFGTCTSRCTRHVGIHDASYQIGLHGTQVT